MYRASTFPTSDLASVPVRCAPRKSEPDGGVPCVTRTSSKPTAFEVTSKRRRGFPSEARVKRGDRVVGGSKELLEKLGRNDQCPCGSGRRFQALLHAHRAVRWVRSRPLLLGKWYGRRLRRPLKSHACCLTSRCSGTGIDKVHARHCHASIWSCVRAPLGWRPPAELGR
jgi:hypothetical protein